MTTPTVTIRIEPLVDDDWPLLLGRGIELVLRGIDDVRETAPLPFAVWATCELLCEVAVT